MTRTYIRAEMCRGRPRICWSVISLVRRSLDGPSGIGSQATSGKATGWSGWEWPRLYILPTVTEHRQRSDFRRMEQLRCPQQLKIWVLERGPSWRLLVLRAWNYQLRGSVR